MGQAALHLRTLLGRLGHAGEIFAEEVAPSLRALVRPANELHPGPKDRVLYHHGIASPLAGRLMHLSCPKGLVFHNISPRRFYEGTSLEKALVAGRAQLAALAPHVDLAIGVSKLNAAELEEAGFGNVHVVPLWVEPSRFGPMQVDLALSRKLSRLGPYVLSVSRVVRHKRVEDLIALHRELRRLVPAAHLVVVGGYAEGDAYFRECQRLARSCGNVHFLGKVGHGGLVAAYRGAAAYVSMSEHEGFGVPLIEAMAAQVPVLAYAAAAVPETLGGRGICFDEKRFATLAELLAQMLSQPKLRERIVAGQLERLSELSAARLTRRLADALDTVSAPPPTRRRPPKKPRVAIVVQRYGKNITGGAEAHARQIAQRLAPHWQLTILTSCAKDHLSWANELPAGTTRDGPVLVRRFPSLRARHMPSFNRLSKELFDRPSDRLEEENWIAEQGPVSPGLFEHLARPNAYDGFVFFTYLYAPTVWGLPLVANRSLLVPTAHDEAPFWMGAYEQLFRSPRALLCNTPEERDLIARRCPDHAPAKVVGVGVELPAANPERFKKKHRLSAPYLMYVGRLEEGKGLGELLVHHAALRRRVPGAPELVLAGAGRMKIDRPGVRVLGRISEQDKADGLAGALAVVVPSRFESLSLLALEAFASGTPVLGNGQCAVLGGQLRRSGAGYAYEDAGSFERGVRQVMAERSRLGQKGLRFAQQHRWDEVVGIYVDEMNKITGSRRRR